jgi:nicotinate-nucleotide--dimethylbenzimidazole phosphoribosyltransferase
MLLDGYISAVAGYYAVKLSPQARDWMLFGHRSLEPGHQHVLRGLQATPILNLRMRLGEGSGAAVAFTIIQSALALHHYMATFSSAGVTGQHI